MSKYDTIKQIVESYMVEEEGDNTLAKIYFNDLDMVGKKKILEAIEASNEGLKIFSDNVVRERVEELLSTGPMMVLDGENVIHNFDLLSI